MQSPIFTQRLSLHFVTEDDHAFMMELVNTKGWLQFIGDRNVHSKEDAISYIKKVKATENLTYWVVKLKDEQILVGVISFIKRKYLDNFDIGFAFLPEHNGKGYAYEAASEVLAMASKMPEHATVVATTIPGNTNSVKLLNKLGLHFEKEIEVDNEKLNLFSNAVLPQ
jgi:RimJ/RimL family protein N-acetyltransferase